MSKWRTGRKVGRTLYEQRGAEPSDDDPLIGVMDKPEDARSVVVLHNALDVCEKLLASNPALVDSLFQKEK